MRKNVVETIAGIVGLVVILVVVFIVIGNVKSNGNKTTEKNPTTKVTTARPTTTNKPTTKETPKTYNITYDLDGGTNGDNPISYIEGTEIILKDAKKNGYTFLGWYLDSDYTVKVTKIDATSTGNIKLYAKFEIIYDNTITYHLDGGINNPANPAGLVDGDEITLLDPSKEDYMNPCPVSTETEAAVVAITRAVHRGYGHYHVVCCVFRVHSVKILSKYGSVFISIRLMRNHRRIY